MPVCRQIRWLALLITVMVTMTNQAVANEASAVYVAGRAEVEVRELPWRDDAPKPTAEVVESQAKWVQHLLNGSRWFLDPDGSVMVALSKDPRSDLFSMTGQHSEGDGVIALHTQRRPSSGGSIGLDGRIIPEGGATVFDGVLSQWMDMVTVVAHVRLPLAAVATLPKPPMPPPDAPFETAPRTVFDLDLPIFDITIDGETDTGPFHGLAGTIILVPDFCGKFGQSFSGDVSVILFQAVQPDCQIVALALRQRHDIIF